MVDIALARACAVHSMPYLASLLFALQVEESEQVPTAAVTKDGVLYLNPRFWAQLSPREGAFVLLHEVLHLYLQHAERRGEREAQLWNLAGDLVINASLMEAIRRGHVAVEMPRGELAGILPEDLDLPYGLAAEEYYERLTHKKVQFAPGLLRGRCGSGAGGEPSPAERKGKKGLSPLEKEILVRQVAQEVERAMGEVPAALARHAQALLRPKVDWRKALREYVRASVAEALGKCDYTFQRPSRREGDVILPSLRQPKLRAVVVVDTSGSVSEAELQAALAEVKGILKATSEVTVVACDAEVHGHARAQAAERLRAILRGGGGTDMGVGIAYAQRFKPDVVVVLTDGYTPWPKEKPPVPVVVGLLLPHAPPPPAWARVVHVGERNQRA